MGPILLSLKKLPYEYKSIQFIHFNNFFPKIRSYTVKIAIFELPKKEHQKPKKMEFSGRGENCINGIYF